MGFLCMGSCPGGAVRREGLLVRGFREEPAGDLLCTARSTGTGGFGGEAPRVCGPQSHLSAVALTCGPSQCILPPGKPPTSPCPPNSCHASERRGRKPQREEDSQLLPQGLGLPLGQRDLSDHETMT